MNSIRALIPALLFSASLFGQSPTGVLKITPLANDFYIFTTWQSYKGTPVPANGMYLVTGKGVVMFDTPWDTTQFQPLLDSIELKHHKKVIMCLATHSHEDRTGGLEFYRKYGAKTYTTSQTDAICKKTGAKRAGFLIDKDTTFSIGGHTFQTYYPGQGHTPDNIVVWFEKEKILYGGCVIKSVEARDLGYTGNANIKAWPVSIRNIKKKFKKPKFVIPGHQDWNNIHALDHTLKLLRQHVKSRQLRGNQPAILE